VSTRILLVDDHTIFRAGIKALLEPQTGIEIVGEASSGDEGVDKARALKPSVVIMDLSMPGSDGLEATRRIVALGLASKVIVLTSHEEDEILVSVIEAGASGYVSKSSAESELINAVRTVAGGQVYLPPKATTLLLKRYKSSGEEGPGLKDLSTREQEVLALTAEGYSSSEIGKKLFISPKTVDTYRARIAEKLGLHHRTELVRFALKAGLLRSM
jgi:DNA-binding NarL/FixJ family response regulator